MKKLIYIATLLTLVGTQGRLLADKQSPGENVPVSGEQEKSLTPAQEPAQAPEASVQQEPVRQEDVVAEIIEEQIFEEPKAEPASKTEQHEAPPAEPAMK